MDIPVCRPEENYKPTNLGRAMSSSSAAIDGLTEHAINVKWLQTPSKVVSSGKRNGRSTVARCCERIDGRLKQAK